MGRARLSGMEYVTVQGEGVPAVGLGTWGLTGEECRRTVETALDVGYRHVDTAQAYGNEREVGQALASSGVDRDEVFLTTKVRASNARYDEVLASTEESRSRLGVETIDLLLLHWPTPMVPIAETMRAMTDLRERGRVRHVGVSNCNVKRLRAAREATATPVFADQVLCHPYHPQRELQAYCAREDVLLTAYSPLGQGGLVADDTLRKIGERYGKTPAQVALRWAIQQDHVAAIPKASSRAHLVENLDVFDFALTRYELDQVARPSLLRTGYSYVRGRFGP